MNPIQFKTFDEFKEMDIKPSGGDKSLLFYSRTFGHRYWGFAISGFYDISIDGGKAYADYLQVQFLCNDVQVDIATGALFGNQNNGKLIYIKGITSESYAEACKWITEHREKLLESVLKLKGELDPLVEIKMRELIQTETIEQEVIGD
jgi:hypothetical protein